MSPLDEYQARLEQRRASHAALEGRESLVSNLRLVLFLAGVALLILVLVADVVHPLWLIAPLALFLVVVVFHDVVIRRRDLAAESVRYHEQALRRLDGTWPGTGTQRVPLEGSGEDEGEGHPYAADLDLFGEGSLFELLCTARTRAGQETLARWLLAPAPADEVRRRQGAVETLRDRLDLREDVALLGAGVQAELDPERLARWGEAAPRFPRSGRLLGAAAGLLTLAAVAAGTLWALALTGPLPLLGVALVEAAIYRLTGPRLKTIVGAVDRAGRELRVLASVLARLEREVFDAPMLRNLQGQLRVDGRTASGAIGRLDRLVTWLDAQRNALFAPVGFLLMWTLHFGLAIERWRGAAGGGIRRWLDAVGQLEALGALAGYAYEHPEDPFPELTDGPARLDGQGLGHPLIAEPESVRNDVTLDAVTRAWIVSGSNMSGKTTLLRTVGVNAVLAQAGGPVRARSLTLTPLAVGATIRVHDSLQAKRSRFYAEVQRLKQLMDLADGPSGLLFLLDEILHGTNSQDRRVGATALLRQLLERGAVGLVTTHDLAIADASDRFQGKVANMHFEDHMENGKLAFDYRVRTGVVQRSNAIALMRAVGLDIQEHGDE